jgi:hypothetical protein
MTVLAESSKDAVLSGRWRNPAAWLTTVDVLAVLTAASLPWSTSLPAIFVSLMLLATLPFLDVAAFQRLLRRPICVTAMAFFLLGVVGTLWSDASWGTGLHAVAPTVKLLVLPVLFFHFQRSDRGMWVFAAFLISCALLAVMSWIVVFDPSLSLKSKDAVTRGIFVKNYIDQSQEFTLCAVAMAYPIVTLAREKKLGLALSLLAVALGFVLTMAFVIVSRTALVTMPIMLAVFAFLHLKWRTIAVIFCAGVALAMLVWTVSPQLRFTASSFVEQYQKYKEVGTSTSIGERLVFWEKSLQFFADAPFLGHGTGSTRGLFERVATGPIENANSRVVGNPHNQTLNAAVQCGVIGVVVLYAMWMAHLLLFRAEGLAAWIGLLVVVQNIFTSLFNSHLFDFHEGWMYVLGVGIAGGMVLKKRPA